MRPRAKRILSLNLRQRKALNAYLFIAPWLIGFFAFLAWPLAKSFIISFQSLTSLFGFQFGWIGLTNYKEALLIDERFVPILAKILADSLIEIPIIIVFSLSVALLVNKKFVGTGFFRAVFFLPVVIGSGLVVQQLFNQGVGSETASFVNVNSLAEIVFQYLGPKAVGFLLELVNTITLVLWRSGVQIVIFVAGLQGISRTYYEAARCDGATMWDLFWKVTLPILTPIILLNIIYTIVDFNTDVFNQLVFFIQKVAFGDELRLGYAAALGWIYFGIVFTILVLVLVSAKKWVFYAGERQ